VPHAVPSDVPLPVDRVEVIVLTDAGDVAGFWRTTVRECDETPSEIRTSLHAPERYRICN
jgi:hypothetical protein